MSHNKEMSKVNHLVKINLSYLYGILRKEETLELIKVLKLKYVPLYVIQNVAKDVRFTKTAQHIKLIHLLASPKRHWRIAVANKFQKHIDNEPPF